jgi:hypothetical protein
MNVYEMAKVVKGSRGYDLIIRGYDYTQSHSHVHYRCKNIKEGLCILDKESMTVSGSHQFYDCRTLEGLSIRIPTLIEITNFVKETYTIFDIQIKCTAVIENI